MKFSRTAFLLISLLIAGCTHSKNPQVDKSAPDEELAGHLYAKIWGDLNSNALIGNGNPLAAAWANAGRRRGGSAPLLHIQNLLCSGTDTLLRCEFGLLRDGGVAEYLGEPTPDKLACSANFGRADPNEQWSIPRLPPGPNGGHSRITIECEPTL